MVGGIQLFTLNPAPFHRRRHVLFNLMATGVIDNKNFLNISLNMKVSKLFSFLQFVYPPSFSVRQLFVRCC